MLKFSIWQVVSTAILALLLGLGIDRMVGVSFGIGGLIGFIPGWVFGKIYFKRTGRKTAKVILQGLYYGELTKLLVTIVLFCGAFQLQSLHMGWLFLGFISAQLVYWVALFHVSTLS